MPLLKTKLKNQICKHIPEQNLKFQLKNININGEKRGCSGHITYLPTNRCIYVNTEHSVSSKLLFRFAKDENDWTSLHNDFAAINQYTTPDNITMDIVNALTMSRQNIHSITKDTVNYQ